MNFAAAQSPDADDAEIRNPVVKLQIRRMLARHANMILRNIIQGNRAVKKIRNVRDPQMAEFASRAVDDAVEVSGALSSQANQVWERIWRAVNQIRRAESDNNIYLQKQFEDCIEFDVSILHNLYDRWYHVWVGVTRGLPRPRHVPRALRNAKNA